MNLPLGTQSPHVDGSSMTRSRQGVSAWESFNRDQNATTLLILEDFDEIRASLAQHFERTGYRVYSAARIEDAVAISQGMLPTIILVDHDLMYERWQFAVKTLRTQMPGSKIIVLGGVDSAALSDEALSNGASEVFPGGYELEKLNAIITNGNA